MFTQGSLQVSSAEKVKFILGYEYVKGDAIAVFMMGFCAKDAVIKPNLLYFSVFFLNCKNIVTPYYCTVKVFIF